MSAGTGMKIAFVVGATFGGAVRNMSTPELAVAIAVLTIAMAYIQSKVRAA